MVIGVGWELACAAHSLIASATGLIAARFALGFAEGGGFRGSAKAVSEWFTPKERSFAIGLFNAGSAIGSTVAAPLVAWLALTWGWRSAFIVTGAIGVLWATAWGWIYRPLRECRRVGAAEKTMLTAAEVGAMTTSRAPSERWLSLLGIRAVWVLMLARLLTGGPWFFMIFWFPKYLGDVWHFDTKQVGWYGWLPYAFGGIGIWFGGAFSSWLMYRGLSLDSPRKFSLGISAFLLPAAIVIALSPP